MLEQIGLQRDAITALEKGKFIDEAASILMRMQRPARAGVIYSRNGRWKEAAQCFIQSGNLADAAACMREAGNYFEAADLFLKENMFESAAECFEHAGRWLEASRAWTKAGKQKHTIKCWKEIGNNLSLLKGQTPTADEVETLYVLAKSGIQNPGIIKLIARSNKINSLSLRAISEGYESLAVLLLRDAPDHIIPLLVRDVNIQSPEARSLAKILTDISADRFAAMLYEQMDDFENACSAFEKAGETDRARYCRERLGKEKPRMNAGQRGNNHSKITTPKLIKTPFRGNFYIDTGSNKIENENLVPSQTNTSQAIERRPEDRAINDDIDERDMLKSSWLFDMIPDYERSAIVSGFKVINISKRGIIQSGAPSSFLVYVVRGEFTSGHGHCTAGDWLTPELALSSEGPVTWTAENESRTLVLTAPDFDALLGSNAELMSKVLVNLTRHQSSDSSNPLKYKVV
jgi:tetratricopeptide (TPR) repeat protein